MKYRIEMDALNALVEEQRTTNELLRQIITAKPETPVLRSLDVVNGTTPKRQYQRRVKS
jgi:hypothetical protein